MDAKHTEKALALGKLLVNQKDARVIIPALSPEAGFWFGGGNTVEDSTGNLWICGRYRNSGDSRFGVNVGERGAELAIFRSDRGFSKVEKVLAFRKSDLNANGLEVISIEGSKLHFTANGVELFVSTEKKRSYPQGIEEFQKPGTGIWSIEHAVAPSIEALKDAELSTILQTDDPEVLHIKDPVVYDTETGDTVLAFCTHPFNWSSSNSGFAVRPAGATDFSEPDFTFFRRGFTWDVAMSRVTSIMRMPSVGAFSKLHSSLFFYDGGECMRNLDEHKKAVKRPRGYSCEELGGLAYIRDDDLASVKRISRILPAFVSPHGTGSSRYVDVLAADDAYFVTWQQSQKDESQPLVGNVVQRSAVEKLLRE
ncbi:MAG: exo-alpha-sialidase [Spirochaetota bacterium]